MTMRIVRPQRIENMNPEWDYWGLAVIYEDNFVPDSVVCDALQKHPSPVLKNRKNMVEWKVVAELVEHDIARVDAEIFKQCGHRAEVRPVLIY